VERKAVALVVLLVEKQDFEKKLVGNQKRIDANNDGKITGEDFKILNESDEEKKAVKSDSQIEKEIIAMFKKEGGALGMKNLKSIAPPKELNRMLDAMMRKKIIYKHKHGDLIMR
jgi:hypothetical protein